MKKGRLVNNLYYFEPVLILTTHSGCAVCLLVKWKEYEASDKALRIDDGYNISKS